MKRMLFILCIALNSALFSQIKTVDQLLETIEHGITFDLYTDLPDIRFNQDKLTSRLSSHNLFRAIKSSDDIARFQNIEINGFLKLTMANYKIKKLIFINCSFEDSVLINTVDISDHIAFLGCRFKKNILLNDLSTKSMTFLANEIEEDFKFTARYKNNFINDFLFALNHLKMLSVEAGNIYISCPYAGSIEFKNVAILSNSANKAFFSGIKTKNNLFVWFNIFKEIEYNSVYTGGFMGFKYNIFDLFKLKNQLENDKANYALSHNSIDKLELSNYFLNFFLLSQNKVRSIKVGSFRAHSFFGLRDNIFSANAEIVLNSCDAHKLSFRTRRDSIYVITPDTLSSNEADSLKYLSIREPILKIDSPDSGRVEVVKLNLKKLEIDENNDNYSISLYNCDINSNNWLFDFKTIQKKGNLYRLNPGDTLFSKRHEIYTSIQNAYKGRGNWEQADACYYEWKEFERQNYFKYSKESFSTKLAKSLFNHLNWVSCGYGIKPLRIFPFAFLIILLFAVFYYFTPQPISNLEYYLVSGDKIKKKLRKLSLEELQKIFSEYDFDFEAHKRDLVDDIISSIDSDELAIILKMKPKSKYNPEYFWNCFYFSFSTFTTVGIGDWYPSGKLNKAIVMIEGSLGWLCLGLFITTYANILLR